MRANSNYPQAFELNAIKEVASDKIKPMDYKVDENEIKRIQKLISTKYNELINNSSKE